MGYKLASSVWRDLDGWPFAHKAALACAANEANAKTGELLLSAQTLADLAGCGEQLMRRALTRALDESLCEDRGHYYGRTRRIVFPDPDRIIAPQVDPASQTASPQVDPVSQTASPQVDPVSQTVDPVSQTVDPVSQTDIKGSHGSSRKGARARATSPEITTDDRQPWQIRNDREAAEENERTRARTPAERAEIERKRAHVDAIDAAETARRDAELADLTPEDCAAGEAIARRLGVTPPSPSAATAAGSLKPKE